MLLAALLVSSFTQAQAPAPPPNATAPASAAPEMPLALEQPPPLLAEPTAPFSIRADTKLLDLVVQFGAATSTAFVIDKESRDVLSRTQTGLLGELAVEPRQAWTTVESLLLANGFLLQLAPSDGPVLVELIAAGNFGRRTSGDFSARPLTLSPAHLGWFARHPAFLGRVVFELPHTDVRQLVNSLRVVQTQNSVRESIINAGQANAVLATGTGAYLVQTARLFQRIDEISSRQPVRPAPVEPAR
jgi:hypothetical protein